VKYTLVPTTGITKYILSLFSKFNVGVSQVRSPGSSCTEKNLAHLRDAPDNRLLLLNRHRSRGYCCSTHRHLTHFPGSLELLLEARPP